jgi:hypothetical protein
MVHQYKYYVSGHYPSSRFYLKHHPLCISKHNVSESGFSLRLQVKPTSLSPLDGASHTSGDRRQETESSLRNVVFRNTNRKVF